MFFGQGGLPAQVPTKLELLELALDDDVESRILQKRGESKWSKEYGPFDRKSLRNYFLYDDDDVKAQSKQPTSWTLLVQEVDRHVPAVADIWEAFDFVPSWRRDDVMISYASRGGGIGAHVDNYDVFLFQGRGTREWSIENSFLSLAQEKSREVPNVDTRLLRDFRADQSWVLQPGDVLYLPPRVPHRGTALGGGCTTVSLGFRAPSYRSMLTALTSHICESRLPEGLLYSDPDLAALQRHLPPGAPPSAVSPAASQRIRAPLRKEVLAVLDGEGEGDGEGGEFDRWLGSYLTEPLRMQVRNPTPFFLSSLSARKSIDDEDYADEEEGPPLSVTSPAHAVASARKFESAESLVSAALGGQVALRRAEGVRVALVGDVLFFNGEAFSLPKQHQLLAAALSAGSRTVSSDALRRALGATTEPSAPGVRYLSSLIRSGYFYPVEVLDRI